MSEPENIDSIIENDENLAPNRMQEQELEKFQDKAPENIEPNVENDENLATFFTNRMQDQELGEFQDNVPENDEPNDENDENLAANVEIPVISKSERRRLAQALERQRKELELAVFQETAEINRNKRLEYILEQTEIYSHFVANMQDANKNQVPTKSKKSKKRKAKVIVKFEETPDYIKNGEMRDYQLDGLNWLITLYDNGMNGILADEMGLGKTLQTISMIAYLKHHRKVKGKHLIIVPKSVVTNWLNEFQRWCPSIETVAIMGEKYTRKEHIKENVLPGKWDVCIASYEMALIETSALKIFNWHYLVVDEGHRIKNEKTQLASTLRTLTSEHRLLLTGTPLQNNTHELWALLNFLLPDVFNSADDFDSWFDTETCLNDKAIIERLNGILTPFLLRRIKSEVEKSLLPKKEVTLFVGMSPMQREWYMKVLMKDVDVLNGFGELRKKYMDGIMQALRQCCDHPYIFRGAEGFPPYITDQHLIDNSGKMVVLDKLLTKLKTEGSRVLIFCQFLDMLDILEDYCVWRKYKYCRLDGSTDYDDRARDIDEFNAPGSDKFIYMISTRAGGLGINLATADTVIIYHSDWNPQADIQAIDRAHRIGQKKQVRVFRLLAENTIEENIHHISEVKLRLDRMIVQTKNKTNAKVPQPNFTQILRLAGHSMQGTEITDDDIDVILERCERKTDEQTKEYEKIVEGGIERVKSFFDFEGEDFREKRKRVEEERLFVQLPPRKAKKLRTTYEDNEEL